jgi:ribonuclease PH
MTSKGDFVEVQGTAEGKPYSKSSFDSVLSLADKGIRQLFEIQQETIDRIIRL